MEGKCWNSSSQPREWVKGTTVGAGSFGVVNLGMNKFTGELFAVKSAISGDGLRSLENEANILENLNSPYIIRCLGKEFSREGRGDEHERLNLFMEFMAGGSLSDVAEKFGGVLDDTVIRRYTREILQGLKYLHKNGIAHGDLKCKNVLVGSSGNTKLADFGCAKRLLRSSKTDDGSKNSWQSLCGTPLWAAPEVLRNEGLSFASDIWSLGCTIVEMATGKAPWEYDVLNPMAAVFKIACGNDVPKFPTELSKEGLDFLAKCFQRDPKMRWTSAELLDHPFISKISSCHKEDSYSPASVFEFGLYESDSDSDGLWRPLREESRSRVSSRRSKQNENLPSWIENDIESSENWVTVRG